MPPDIAIEREVFDLLTENHIDFIRIDSLGKGDSQSLQFFTGKTSDSLCSASQSSLFGLGFAQEQLSDLVFETPNAFRPVLLFSTNFSLIPDQARRQLGVSVANLIANLSKSKLKTGLYHVPGFTCVATCAKWLDLICENRSNLVQPNVVYFSRLITPADFALWQDQLAQSSEPWELLDTLLEESKIDRGDWDSNLSVSAARSVLEEAKQTILSGPYAEPISALVQDYDKRQAVVASGPLGMWSDYLANLQVILDQSVGAEGSSLLETVKKFSSVLECGQLALTKKGCSGEYYRLDTKGANAFMKELASGKSTLIESLPELDVVSLASVKSQRLANQLSHKTIKLEPINQVSKMSFKEFVEYFDRVLPHVENEGLIKQFQRWLDDFPDELRDFGNNVDAKRVFARSINERAKLLGCRFSCPVENCGLLCGMSAALTGTSKKGQFIFAHELDGKRISHFRSASLPKITLHQAE